jgi:prepilin-type N-terminal cleavage/methylation domain-containing protein
MLYVGSFLAMIESKFRIRVNVKHSHSQQGFTLVEILLVLAIFVLLASLSIPRFGSMVSRNHLKAATAQVMSDLMLARKRALSQQHSVQIRFKDTQHYEIWDDRNNDNRQQRRDEITLKDIASFGARIESNNNPRFWPSGSVTHLATIWVQHPSAPEQKARCITISIIGRVKQSVCRNKEPS